MQLSSRRIDATTYDVEDFGDIRGGELDDNALPSSVHVHSVPPLDDDLLLPRDPLSARGLLLLHRRHSRRVEGERVERGNLWLQPGQVVDLSENGLSQGLSVGGKVDKGASGETGGDVVAIRRKLSILVTVSIASCDDAAGLVRSSIHPRAFLHAINMLSRRGDGLENSESRKCETNLVDETLGESDNIPLESKARYSDGKVTRSALAHFSRFDCFVRRLQLDPEDLGDMLREAQLEVVEDARRRRRERERRERRRSLGRHFSDSTEYGACGTVKTRRAEKSGAERSEDASG